MGQVSHVSSASCQGPSMLGAGCWDPGSCSGTRQGEAAPPPPAAAALAQAQPADPARALHGPLQPLTAPDPLADPFQLSLPPFHRAEPAVSPGEKLLHLSGGRARPRGWVRGGRTEDDTVTSCPDPWARDDKDDLCLRWREGCSEPSPPPGAQPPGAKPFPT